MLGRIADRMEFFLNSMEVYLAIGIVGTVISFLYGMFGELGEMRLAFFLTVWIMATIRILTEKRYFKRYDAIPSSSQFIVLPFLLSLYLQAFGNVMPSPFIEQSSWSISEYMIFITGGSIMIFPHIIFQWYIFDKVHSKKWLGFAVHRKLFMTRKVPFAVHAIMTVTMTYLIWTSKKMEITAVFSIFFWIFMTARHYFHKSRPQNISQNRGYLSNPVISDYLRRPSRQSRRRREIIQQSNVRRMQSPSQPTSTRREKKRSSRGNVQPTLRINRHLVEIDQGTEIKIESKKRKRKKANGTSLIPSGQFTREDFACAICYEPFSKSDSTVVLCPHCKFPSHERELNEWKRESDLCPRCSKPLGNIPRSYRIPAEKYISNVLSRL